MQNIKNIFNWKWLFIVSISTLLGYSLIFAFSWLFISGWNNPNNIGAGLMSGIVTLLIIGVLINYIMYLSLRNHEKLSEIYKVLAWLLQIPATLYLLFAIFMTLFDNVKTMM